VQSFRKISCFFVALASAALVHGGVRAAPAAPNFKNKVITVIVGSAPGGTTDFVARLLSTYMVKYLPGAPAVAVEDRPGAHSLSALNYFTSLAKPDGLTLAAGSITELDPATYRVPQSRYDPAKFAMIGAGEIGGGVLTIREPALARLTDKSAAPVEMATVEGYPHVTILMAAWGSAYLGWNIKWVQGYPSDAASLILALVRGEVDMTAFSATTLTPTLLDKSKYSILYQTGSDSGNQPSKLATIASVPLFRTAMQGRIQDPLAQQAFQYWCDSSSVAIWLALPPGTPSNIVQAYRAAYAKAIADPEFVRLGAQFSKDFGPMDATELNGVVADFAKVSPPVLQFMPNLLRTQGMKIE
jgi:hypothetical protein